MEVVFEGLIPGVQDGDDAHGSTKTGAAKLKQGLTDGFEEKAEENLFVGEDQAVENVRQGKDQMKVTHGQKLRGLPLKPLGLGQRLAFRAVAVTAGVVGRVLKAASVALLEMTSQLSRAADLNGPHDLFMGGGKEMRLAVALPVLT